MADPGAVARRITSVDHVAIAVREMTPAARLFTEVLGGSMISGGDNDVTGARVAQFACVGFKIELMQPLRADSLLGRHLARGGEGFHHVTFMVDDVAQTVTDLEEAGFSCSGTDVTSDLWSETFLSPRHTFGALLQFARASQDFGVMHEKYTLEDVLAGRVTWKEKVACLR